eukprot:s26_g77.t1
MTLSYSHVSLLLFILLDSTDVYSVLAQTRCLGFVTPTLTSVTIDSRSAMTYHLGNTLLHLQYLAGHMPWFVPPADVPPAPASMPFSTSPGLTSLVPHPGRLPNSACSSRPTSDFTVITSTVDGQTGVFVDPPDPNETPSALSPTPVSMSPNMHSAPGSRHPPRGLSISRSPPIPLSRHYPLTDSASTPAPEVPTPVSSTTPPATTTATNPVSVANPSHPPSPVMAPDRRVKRRRVTPATTPASSCPSTDMPPPPPPSSVASHHPPDSSNPSASVSESTSGPILPVSESPPPNPPADPAITSDSDDSNLSTRPSSPALMEGSSAPIFVGPSPPISDLFRNWAPVDDNELITYKKDTKARPSWKTIGQRLHRSAESCRARWLWLKSTGRDRTNVLAPLRNEEE